jgi:lipid-binding SYLF domain-containing protein
MIAAASMLVLGCSHAPKTASEREALSRQAVETVQRMTANDPELQSVLDQSVGYIVFPQIKQGGFIVGGASGRGVVFEHGRQIGFAELSQTSVGAQVGGQRYAELVVARDRVAFDRLRSGNLDVGGQASAVILRAGAAAATRFENGIAVFVQPERGAMLNVSLTGQRIRFTG